MPLKTFPIWSMLLQRLQKYFLTSKKNTHRSPVSPTITAKHVHYVIKDTQQGRGTRTTTSETMLSVIQMASPHLMYLCISII